jgi:tetratricopeptide (TPR) repeat protein
MIRFAFAFILAPTLAFADCPENVPRTDAHERLMAEVKLAENEMEARLLTNELWEVWATAPDETSQAILQRGMERRASYNFAGAIEDFDTLIEYCPNYAEGYNQRAFVSFIRGDWAVSLEDLERAIEITPDHIGAVVGRALALMQLGRNKEGQLALREALLLNPWLPERNRLVPLEDVEDKTPSKDL